jgi:hypothetical protein
LTSVAWVFDFVNNHQFPFLNVSKSEELLVLAFFLKTSQTHQIHERTGSFLGLAT